MYNELSMAIAARLIATEQVIREAVEQIIGEVRTRLWDAHPPPKGEVSDVCQYHLAEIAAKENLDSGCRWPLRAIVRKLRAAVLRHYDIRSSVYEQPQMNAEARRYLKYRRDADNAGVEPTDAARAEFVATTKEEIRACRMACTIAGARPLKGDTVIRDGNGQVRMITARSRGKHKVRESRDFLEGAFENLCDAATEHYESP